MIDDKFAAAVGRGDDDDLPTSGEMRLNADIAKSWDDADGDGYADSVEEVEVEVEVIEHDQPGEATAGDAG